MASAETSARSTLERALLDPASAFATPQAVLDDARLSRQQKIEALRRWAYEANAVCVAVEEGMPGGESDLLRRILLALDPLRGGGDLEHVGPTQQDGIPSSTVESD